MSQGDTIPAVGSRLLVGKHGATIRYVGPVEGQDGVWVGLEWDDPTRGKHDGSHAGTRYFSCLRHTHPATTTAGSFVRLAKLISTADLGQSLEIAVQSRYKIQTDDGGNIVEDAEMHSEAYVPTASNRRVQIRLVGAAAMAAKVSQDGTLEHASFIDQRISNLTITSTMGIPFLRNVATLDLSNNLIGSWMAVAELVQSLPHLHTLNLSGNLLDIDTNTTILPSLKTLVLNNCGVRWSQVVYSLARCVPHLTALHLCRNNISTLALLPSVPEVSKVTEISDLDGKKIAAVLAKQFPKLETLDLEENHLDDWNELAAQLHTLPHLKILQLSGNNLKEITYSYLHTSNIDSSHGTIGFQSLEHLTVGANQFSNWTVADELDKFPSLVDLRISNNPLTNPGATTDTPTNSNPNEEEEGAPSIVTAAATTTLPIRYELIARISKLQMLNGSDIRAGERQDAELAYLRLVTDQIAEAKHRIKVNKKTSSDCEVVAGVEQKHPKFSYLISKYGELAASGPSSTQGTTLSSSMVELIFVSGSKQVKKKVPLTLTIGRLKPLLERVLRIKLGHQCLSLVDPGNSAHSEDVTSQDGKELGFYGVTSGWRVEVGERDVAAAVAAKSALVAEQERRMDEHERGLQRLRAEEERLMVG
jgi:Leucine-rich repeat (LRR) protein